MTEVGRLRAVVLQLEAYRIAAKERSGAVELRQLRRRTCQAIAGTQIDRSVKGIAGASRPVWLEGCGCLQFQPAAAISEVVCEARIRFYSDGNLLDQIRRLVLKPCRSPIEVRGKLLRIGESI